MAKTSNLYKKIDIIKPLHKDSPLQEGRQLAEGVWSLQMYKFLTTQPSTPSKIKGIFKDFQRQYSFTSLQKGFLND